MSMNTASLYWIYGKGDEDNIYESIRKQKPLPTCPVYDEVFQKEWSANTSLSPPPHYRNIFKENQNNEGIQKLIEKYRRFGIFVKIATILLIAGITLVAGKQTGGYMFGNAKKANLSQTGMQKCEVNTTEFITTTSKDYSEYIPTNTNETSYESPEPYYTYENWFKRNEKPKYNCSSYKIISQGNIQIVGKKCGNVTSCQGFISSYQQSQAYNAKFTFFIDEAANVYEGRSWICPYRSGEFWVAVIVNGLDPLHLEREPVLQHLIDDVITFGKHYGYLCKCLNIQVIRAPI